MQGLDQQARREIRRDGPTPLELAHALRTTAHWVRTAPDPERCSGTLATRGSRYDKCEPNEPDAAQWCALGRTAHNLGVGPEIYTIWESWVPASAYSLHTLWDEACYTRNGITRNRHDRQKAFETVAQRMDEVAAALEQQIHALQPA